MPGHKRIQSVLALAPIPRFFWTHQKIPNSSQTFQKEDLGAVLLQRHVLECLPVTRDIRNVTTAEKNA